MKSKEIAEGFGVSVATMQAKAKVIRKGLDLIPFHPDWSLPSRMDNNPQVWMLEVNGFPTDIRMAPREAQVAAYEKGLIPYIPGDRKRQSRTMLSDRPERLNLLLRVRDAGNWAKAVFAQWRRVRVLHQAQDDLLDARRKAHELKT